MLNTRYIIQPLENGKETVVRNPGALGNAWFVSEVKWVDNADAEMEAITDFDPSFTAVADRKFKNEIGEKSFLRLPVTRFMRRHTNQTS